MYSRTSRFLIAATACTSLVATPVLAQKASALVGLNGAPVANAENELRSLGFKNISSHRGSGGFVNSYWWNGRSDNCVVVETRGGQIMTVNDASDQDCGHHTGNAGAAAGAVAGAALLGALLASKSHHREGQQYDETKTAEFDRGYKDGLYNGAYHNYNRNDAYSHGYQKGVEEREANLSHHHRRGGYSAVARIDDLNGARAAGGMDTLSQRGFRQVDNFTSGNTRYSIQYRPESRQCIQVTIADGHFYDVSDIGQHPKCAGGSGAGQGMGTTPTVDFDDVIGRSGEKAREILNGRGFTRVARFGDDSTRYAIMWRAQSGQCLQMMIVSDRVADIRDIGQHPNCR